MIGGATAYAALAPSLGWTRKARRAQLPLQPWSLPPEPPQEPLELTRALAGAAVLAPSAWNTQPWALQGNGGWIRLLADPGRAMPVNDPDGQEMLLSLGAALENLLVTARSYGLRPSVTYFPDGERSAAVARVSWSPGGGRRDRDLFLAIPERRTNRREYDGRGIFMENRAALSAQVPEELRIHWLDGEKVREVADLLYDATRAQVMDRASQAERWKWIRFGDDEAREKGDGVTVDELRLAGPARWLARRYFDPRSRFLALGAGSAAKQAREVMRSAGAAALLTTPRSERSLILTAGQAFERFALKAARLGIAIHPMNAPLEMPSFRTDAARLFGAIGEHPVMLVRLGHARRTQPSVRRSVALVTSFRSS